MVQARKVLLCKEHATEEYKKFYGNASAEFLLDREYEKIRVFEGGKVACAATSGRTLEQFLGLTALPGHLPNVRLCASCGGDKAGFMIDVKSWSFAECCPIQKETPMCRIHAEEYYREENKKHAETAVKELEATFGQPGTIARSEIRRDAAPAEEGGLIESAELHKITKLVKKYCDTHCRYRKSAVCDSRICPDMVTHEWLRPTLDDETHTVKKCWAHFKSDHVGRLPTLVKFCAAPFCRRTPTRFNANDISLHAGRLLFEFRCAEHAKPKDVAIADE